MASSLEGRNQAAAPITSAHTLPFTRESPAMWTCKDAGKRGPCLTAGAQLEWRSPLLQKGRAGMRSPSSLCSSLSLSSC